MLGVDWIGLECISVQTCYFFSLRFLFAFCFWCHGELLGGGGGREKLDAVDILRVEG